MFKSLMDILTYPSAAYGAQKDLVQRVVDHLGADYRPSYVLLDGEDYSANMSVLDEFRDIAFYWNRDRQKERVPSHVRSLMEDDECSHLIWLSRRALDEEEMLFVWIVAHELRHLYQATHGVSYETLRREVRELRRRREFRDLPSSPLGATELDSDIFALRTARVIFGAEQVTEFLGRRMLPRCPFRSYAEFLRRLEMSCFSEDRITES